MFRGGFMIYKVKHKMILTIVIGDRQFLGMQDFKFTLGSRINFFQNILLGDASTTPAPTPLILTKGTCELRLRESNSEASESELFAKVLEKLALLMPQSPHMVVIRRLFQI